MTIRLFSIILILSAASWGCQQDEPKPVNGNTGVLPNNPQVGDTSLYNLHITVTGFENSVGQIVLALFDSQDGFDNDNPIVGRLEPLTATSHSLVVEDLAVGFYGISCYHDENEDEELNTNFLGIPQEGFGFSTNPSVNFSPPVWSEIRFLLNAEDSIQTIELIYL